MTAKNVNQWRNTQNVIERFGSIEEKTRHSFISFDIVDFYQSIYENLLDQALSWASNLADISDEDISPLQNHSFSITENRGSKTTIVICLMLPWVAMTGTFLADKTRKELHNVFEQFGLKITAEVNLHLVNFLDVTFDLSIGKYKPYWKPNDDRYTYTNTLTTLLAF